MNRRDWILLTPFRLVLAYIENIVVAHTTITKLKLVFN